MMKCLVILLQQCRPDYLGCYGNDWLATPALDRLASESVVFDQHFADAPTPRAARRCWRSGRFAWAPPTDTDLISALWQNGVLTALLGDERSNSFGTRFALGWEWRHWLRRRRLPELEQDSLLGGTVQTAIEWLQQNGSRENWLLWLELSALRPPWDAAEFDAETILAEVAEGFEPWYDPPLGTGHDSAAVDRLRNTYGGVIGGVDQWLGQLFEFLRGAGLNEETLLILTTDVGTPLGDHGVVGVQPPGVYEEAVHLPLIMRLPDGAEAGRRVHQLTQSVDIAPTVAEAFGISELKGAHGQSLLPAARGESKKLREFACSWARHQGRVDWSVRNHEAHLLLPASGEAQFFVKPEDRWDVNNVLSQHQETAERLELQFRRFADRLRSTAT